MTVISTGHPRNLLLRAMGQLYGMVEAVTSLLRKPVGISRVRVRVAVLVIIAILAALLIWQGFQISAGLDRARAAADTLESLNTVETGLVSMLRDMPSLHGTLSRARDDIQKARSHLRIALAFTPLTGWVPGFGDRTSDARDLLSLAENVVEGSLDLVISLEKIVELSRGPILQKDRQLNTRPLQALSASEPQLESAVERFEEAEAIQARLESRDVDEELNRLLSVSQRILPELKGTAEMGLEVSRSWRPFLGYEGPRSYLLVAQNSDELRASGGYLPGAWLLRLNQGHIEHLQFWDTVDVDDLSAGIPTPPGAIVQSLWGGGWLFRDAGWSPDFPTSAGMMERLFRLGTGHSVDGVVAIDQWAVKEIVTAIGPVTLPGGARIDEGSYLEMLEKGKDEVGRVFMDSVLTGMLDGLGTDDSSERFGALMLAMKRSLDQKHLLPYLHDAQLQQRVLNNGWGNELMDSSADYLMVVDSNVGWNKVDRNIRREIDYHLTIDDSGDAQARLDLTYTNESTATVSDPCAIQSPDVAGDTYSEMKNGCYWDYLRVYVPEASRLQNSSPFPMPAGAIYRRLGYNDIEDTLQSYPEDGKAVFSGFFTVAPGETRQVTFVYELPGGLLLQEDGELTYTLVLQKQPGVLETPATITVTLPEGYSIQSATPRPEKLTTDEAEFSVSLNSDSKFELALQTTR